MTTDLKVIGTGFGRTGTDSMREAINLLGFGPCHHMRSLLEDKAHQNDWRDFVAGGPCNWDTLLNGSKSCIDWPTAHFWPELIDRFPNAKVLLTWRTAESWWASFEKTVLPMILEASKKPIQPPGSQLILQQVFANKPPTRDHCIATYNANVERVKATVPAERLLVYKIGDGWGPLCAHLDVQVPDQPFPRSNSTAEFHTGIGAK